MVILEMNLNSEEFHLIFSNMYFIYGICSRDSSPGIMPLVRESCLTGGPNHISKG